MGCLESNLNTGIKNYQSMMSLGPGRIAIYTNSNYKGEKLVLDITNKPIDLVDPLYKRVESVQLGPLTKVSMYYGDSKMILENSSPTGTIGVPNLAITHIEKVWISALLIKSHISREGRPYSRAYSYVSLY